MKKCVVLEEFFMITCVRQNEEEAEKLFAFQEANGNAFLDAYLPIVEKRKDYPFGENEIKWQEIRRGRYVEFNLIHDRGTLFGLKTNGRTESILMSLPPRASGFIIISRWLGARKMNCWKYVFIRKTGWRNNFNVINVDW